MPLIRIMHWYDMRHAYIKALIIIYIIMRIKPLLQLLICASLNWVQLGLLQIQPS